MIYLYSGYLRKHQKDITVLKDLGLGKKTLVMTYLTHLFVLIFLSGLIVFCLIIVTAQFIGPFIQQYIEFSFDFSLDYTFFLQSAVILLVLSLSVGLPLILPLVENEKISFLKKALRFIPFILFLLLLSHFVTPMKNIGFFFALALLVLIFLLFLFGSFVLQKVDFSGHMQSLELSLAFKNITRHKKTSLTLFSAILLCTAFFSLIPQVGSSLSSALTKSVEDRPRFFVVDAKPDQIQKIKQQASYLGGNLENISPMIRGRIIQINNKTQNDTSRDASVNLSYRSKLKQSEQIVQGREFSGVYDSSDFSKPVELSVEERFAKRNGINLNDTITLDVLGLEIEAVVINIRSVKWTDFVPNFFLVLQDGAINDAPKTLLATISQGQYDATQMLLTLTDKFPSLTVIDVKNLFESFADIVKNVTAITQKMSFYSIAIGLLMSFIIIQYQMNLQKNNILTLKIIGITNKTIKNSFLIEFGLITIVASGLGILLGSIGSYIVSSLLFESYWDFRGDILLIYFLLIPILTLGIVSFFTSKIINQKENIF
jgi:predicted lysophospholipase L1 biosynthesis ABC-type transport system permease subunit